MNIRYRFIIVAAVLLWGSGYIRSANAFSIEVAQASLMAESSAVEEAGATPETEAESSGFVGELQYSYYHSRDESQQNSLDTASLYLEKEVWDGYAVFVNMYHDKEFRSEYIGIAKWFGDFQLGVGIGPAQYGGVRYDAVNPWLYYESEDWQWYLHAERYAKEQFEPWWYKGYIKRKFGNYELGLYGERFLGAGPQVGFKFNESTTFSLMVPMISRPNQGGTQAVVMLTFEF